MLSRGEWADTGTSPPHAALTIALESSHLAGQGVQVLDQLLDSQEHFGITWAAHGWAVGTVPWVWLLLLESLETRGPRPGPRLGTPLPSHAPHAQVEGSRGLTCFEFLQLVLQAALQRKHLVIQATGWRGGHSAPRDRSHFPPPHPRPECLALTPPHTLPEGLSPACSSCL